MIHLHSTVVLLKLDRTVIEDLIDDYLHSTVVLLNKFDGQEITINYDIYILL